MSRFAPVSVSGVDSAVGARPVPVSFGLTFSNSERVFATDAVGALVAWGCLFGMARRKPGTLVTSASSRFLSAQ